MIFRIFSVVPFVLAFVILVPIVFGGWGLIHQGDIGTFWAGVALGLVALGLGGYLWYLGSLGAPVTPIGHHARATVAALMFKNIGYLIILAVVIFAATPQGQNWVSHFLLHKP